MIYISNKMSAIYFVLSILPIQHPLFSSQSFDVPHVLGYFQVAFIRAVLLPNCVKANMDEGSIRLYPKFHHITFARFEFTQISRII